ncbi:MAG TPA: kelch repeat-containing protein, partial [Chthoniobacterales bacterium]|nr:kelch repeat-containing protein [Chthoniobacterales bacterium]
MKKLKHNSAGASALQITLSIALIFASAIPLAADSVQNAPAGTEQEQNLTPPAGLKPVEQEAWLALARRQGASGGNELASFYPKRSGQPFVVEGEGGSWVTTGSLATARELHTATPLPAGQVLVAGGVGNSGSGSSAELYDPASGSWSSTGSLAIARYLHT